MSTSPPPTRIALVSFLPGLLVAATGVGAGDLATAAFTGSHLGVTVLWAVALGAFFKYVLNEGLARYQLATGETLLEGAANRLGRGALAVFAPYLLVWSFFVAAALMSACGVTFHAIWPAFADPAHGKVVFGIVHSLAGLGLVLGGGYRLFERVMAACAGLMFVTIVAAAAWMRPEPAALLRGLLMPSISGLAGEGLGWTVALIGGVGGTVTVLGYGYWIREAGRSGPEAIAVCRIDLAGGYVATALFGMAMVVIGSTLPIEGSGAGLVIRLGERIGETLGPVGRAAFLAGAWGAVFSSLLGVWQVVPLLFADAWRLAWRRTEPASERSSSYRVYLIALTLVPMLGLRWGFKDLQKLYAILGASFMPMLALTLLLLNGRRDWVGEHRNRPLTTAVLLLALAFFVLAGIRGAVG